MTLVIALAVGAIFGVGVRHMASRDAITIVAGSLLVVNSVIVLLVMAGWRSTTAPLLPANPQEVSDPLVQALALTAIVIGLGTTVLMLRIVLAVERTHRSVTLDDVADRVPANAERVGEESQ